MRRSALKLGIALLLVVTVDCLPQRLERSVDLNEQHKLESVCICRGNLRPDSYVLEIEPLIQEEKFKGRVRMNITWVEKDGMIILHAHPDLQFSDSDIKVTRLNDVVDEDSSSSEEAKIPAPAAVEIDSIDRDARKLTIHLKKSLERNTTCEIDITYTGNITTYDTSGVFMNHYMDAAGQKHTYVATYLRLNNARKMFPGYDELQYKASFQLILTRPKNMTALSNTPVEKTVPVAGNEELVKDYFVRTPEMATYQLAFVMSDLESLAPTQRVNTKDGQELQVRVWGRREYLEALADVPDKIVGIVNLLQDFFNCTIKLPKLDVVALPIYKATKASDNWGLMIFKESELSSTLVWNTAYELLYQWIGQYITPYRWMDASENKGLNSFLASLTTMEINPEELQGKWPMNILYSLYYGYGKTFDVKWNTGIIREAKFAKIELVFRMFYYILGKEDFKTSMRYLFKSPTILKPDPNMIRGVRTFAQSDIYDSMNFVANKSKALPEGLTINQVADSWVDQNRLPLVTVTRNYENRTITFSQKPYVREARKTPTNTSGFHLQYSWELQYLWNIPLVMKSRNTWTDDDYAPKAWLLKGKVKEDLNMPDIDDKDSFIVVNPEEIGLFPVNYDAHNWQLLSDYLQGPSFERIPTLTRAKLLHDSWNLAYADELCLKIALNMTLFLKHEKCHVVWEPFFTMIDHIGKRIEDPNIFTKFETYARTLLEPMYTEPCENSQASEPSWKPHLRGMARYFLCRAGYKPCIAEAREQFKKWLTGKEPDKGNPVANEFICPVFKWGTDEEWDFGLQRAINFPKNSSERKQSERTYLLKTLAGCPKDPAKIERLLNVTIINRNSNFTDSDVHLILTMMTGDANGYTTLFKFLEQHWDTVKQRLEGKQHLWTRIIRSATGFFKTKEGYDKVNKLLQDKRSDLADFSSIITESLENIKQEEQWGNVNLPKIDDWLTKNSATFAPIDQDVIQYWKEALVCPKTAPAS